jgi:hypothetical protein
MFLESLLMKKLRGPTKESFKEEKPLTFVEIVILVLLCVYIVVAIMLWLRVVAAAFSCSAGQGVSSVIFPGLYSLFKFGDLIKLSC